MFPTPVRKNNLGLWAMMNTSRDLLHLPYTSARRVRRGGPSDLVPFGGAARADGRHTNQGPRASTVGGPGKKGDHVTKAVFLEKLQHGMPSSRGPTSVSHMWSSDAFHGRSSRSGLSTPGIFCTCCINVWTESGCLQPLEGDVVEVLPASDK